MLRFTLLRQKHYGGQAPLPLSKALWRVGKNGGALLRDLRFTGSGRRLDDGEQHDVGPVGDENSAGGDASDGTKLGEPVVSALANRAECDQSVGAGATGTGHCL